MKKSLSYLLFISAFVGASVTLITLKPHHVKANPPFYTQSQSLNTVPSQSTNNCGATLSATTSYSFLQPGLGTTTAVLDTLQCGYSTASADTATLLTQIQSTTTPGNLTISVEASQDGLDWYGQAVAGTPATTTPITSGVYSYAIATTSTDLGSTGSSTFQAFSMTFNVGTRYIRARYYILPGSGSTAKLAIWPVWIAKKQRQ